jgi:glycosyltransferase involved in cell wall biosynthesis
MNHFEFTERKRAHVVEDIQRFDYRPLISIVMPVYNIERIWLEEAIRSVIDQSYQNWELCIVDDASTVSDVRQVLMRQCEKDRRIKVKYLETNLHISGATNEALTLASGDFVTFLDHDDELHPNAIFEVVNLLQAARDADVVYTDSDVIDTAGKRSAPKFKPDWSPELLLSYMYISHLLVCRTDLVRAVGGFRIGYEGSQDHDLVLRLSERTSRIYHVPKVLYHARTLPQSASRSDDTRRYGFAAGIRAVQDAVDRRRIQARVDRPEFAVSAECGIYKLHYVGTPNDKVVIILPTKDRPDCLKRCVESIESKTTYKNWEIVIADDGSTDAATLRYFGSVKHKVLNVQSEGPFSVTQVVNRAVREIPPDIKYILLLNDDTEVIAPNWIEEMLVLMQDPAVGAVGAKLLYEDQTIQHAGVILGLNDGLPGPAFKTLSDVSDGYLFYPNVVRSYSAVTGACMLTRRKYFDEVGGFDEEKFCEAYGDIDYCLRLRAKGYRVVYTPYAELYRHEEETGTRGVPVRDEYAFRTKWGNIDVDPLYSPNLHGSLFHVNPRIGEVMPVRRKIRILFVSNSLRWEGAPLSLLAIVRGLDKAHYEAIVLSREDGPLRESYQKEGVRVFVEELMWRGRSLTELDEELGKVARLIDSLGIDLMFCNTLDTFLAIHVSQRVGIPVIWCIRESSDVQEYFKALCHDRALTRAAVDALQIPTHIIFVARETEKVVCRGREGDGRFRVIHNGIDVAAIDAYKQANSKAAIRRAHSIPDYTAVITVVGSTVRRKGHDVFIKAAIELLKKRQNLLFLIVGGRKGEYLDELERMIDVAGVGSSIKIVPETRDVFPYYRLSDISVCSSHNESLPRVIFEAMAFEIPIVSTNVFGIKEQIEDGVSGVLIPPGDPEQLAEKIDFLLNDPAYGSELVQNAHCRLLTLFTYRAMMRSYERCFQESMMSTPSHYEYDVRRIEGYRLRKWITLRIGYYFETIRKDGVMAANRKVVNKLCGRK